MGEQKQERLFADTVVSGPPVLPEDRIAQMSAGDWERFTLECIDALRPKTYQLVERHTGAGDMGIDVRAFVDRHDADPWDNFQCKHYDELLSPSLIWTELGKIIYYTWRGEYSVPRHYYFCAPRGVGSKLARLLKTPSELKRQVSEAWDAHCLNKISKKEAIPLVGGLHDYFNAFDFSIFSHKPLGELVELHRQTRYYVLRFGGGLPPRKDPDNPPEAIATKETVYVGALFAAYSDHLTTSICEVADLPDGKIRNHFERSRREFYCAEGLREFSVDTLPPDVYPRLEDEIYYGIQDVVDDDHPDGFACVKAAVNKAQQLSIDSHPLKMRMQPTDRAGVCHQLANKTRVAWCKKK